MSFSYVKQKSEDSPKVSVHLENALLFTKLGDKVRLCCGKTGPVNF